MDYFTNHSADIKTFRYWTLMLHENQSYLGRAICYLNVYKEHLVDLSHDEYLELLEIMRQYQAALAKLWKPDRWNYAQIGNVIPHLHIHFIPRYKAPRNWEGKTFVDANWGGHYAPAPKWEPDVKIEEKIRRAIQGALEA